MDMRSYSVIYHKFLHWLFTFTILFYAEAYSDHTSYKSNSNPTEQLAYTYNHSEKVVSYNHVLLKRLSFDNTKNNKCLVSLKNCHSKLFQTTFKKRSFFVFRSEKEHITFLHTNSSKEDSFHFVLG